MENKSLVKLCVDTALNRVQEFSKVQASEVIRKAFIDILGTDKPDFKTYRRHQIEIFEILEEVLDQLIVEGWQNNTFFDRFVETRDIAIGDKNEFYVEDRTMLQVSKIAGNHWDLRRQKLDIGEIFSIPTFWYGAAIMSDFERVLAGRLDWGKFIGKVAEAFDYDIKGVVYGSFLNTQTYLPAEFKETGAYSATNLRKIISHVEASSGSNVVIAGTRSALARITDGISTQWVSDTMRDEKNNPGMVRTWEGVDLLEIPQIHKKNSFEFKLDDNRLMILPNNDVKPIKIVNEGESRIKSVGDNGEYMDMSYEYQFQKKYGVGVIFNVLYGMYELN